ncbi:MAG: adenine deaminase, partial [Bacteroidetes bacterium]|nr:adenine deaminase [Bacteroidota bacterium]
MHSFTITGQLIDIFQRRIYPAEVIVNDGIINAIKEIDSAPDQYLLPGFIDAHVHVESSMLVPTAFAQLAVIHGTVATVSDPHEIANVCGMAGVQYMIDNSKQTPFKFFFGAPSCVPATAFETAGAILDANAIKELLNTDDIWYLSEMMNYPGVLNKDPEVLAKIEAAKTANKPIDGHAPGLKGEL